MAVIRRHWFLIAYLTVLAVAFAWPEPGARGGPLHLDALRAWCIAGIFLCAGLTLPTRKLAGALGAWRIHVLVQSLSFVIAPLLGLAAAWLAGRLGAPEPVQTGLIILACLPTTIGSCVAITGLAGGNQGIALVDSVLGNLLGLVATPLLITLLLGRSGSVAIGTVIGQLALLAVLPVMAGQLARALAGETLDRLRARIGIGSGVLLLVVLLGIFSDLARHGMGSGSAAVVAVCILLHVALTAIAWRSSAFCERIDRIGITITASQKTAALGIPLINLMFANDVSLPLLLLPVVIYHIVQLVAGSLLASKLAAAPPA